MELECEDGDDLILMTMLLMHDVTYSCSDERCCKFNVFYLYTVCIHSSLDASLVDMVI